MQPGSMIGGRYQLVDVVAEGGLSTVWQGVARSSEVFARPVAIKVMKRAFSTVGGPYLSMFLEEARIGARLSPPTSSRSSTSSSRQRRPGRPTAW